MYTYFWSIVMAIAMLRSSGHLDVVSYVYIPLFYGDGVSYVYIFRVYGDRVSYVYIFLVQVGWVSYVTYW